jgi:hypothetical protein
MFDHIVGPVKGTISFILGDPGSVVRTLSLVRQGLGPVRVVWQR